MRKRILALLLTAVMLLAVLPVSVLAEEPDLHKVTFVLTKTDGKTVDLSETSCSLTGADGAAYKPAEDLYGWEENYYLLPDGDYSYRFVYSQKEQGAGKVTVSGQDITVNVQLETILYPITFSVQPENADIQLYKNSWKGPIGDPIQPDENGVYAIPFGQYRYIISAPGYETVNKTFNATDTSLINNGYVIRVALVSRAEQLLRDAVWALEDEAGYPVLLNEFTGNLYEYGDTFLPWALDSEPDDVNVLDFANAILKNEEIEGVTVRIERIYRSEWYYDEEADDASVIELNGAIHYDAVDDGNLVQDVELENGYADGAVCSVVFALSCAGIDAEDTVEFDFVVPAHIMTRQERLAQAADFAVSGIPAVTEENLTLPVLAEDDFWGELSINTEWESSHPDIIAPDGSVTRPAEDTEVTLTLRAFYIDWLCEDKGFMYDPGPFGEDELRTVKVTVPGNSHDVSVIDSFAENSGAGRHQAGTVVELHAGEHEGLLFAGWFTEDDVEIIDADLPDASFLMPERDVTVTARWRRNPADSIPDLPILPIIPAQPDSPAPSEPVKPAEPDPDVDLPLKPDAPINPFDDVAPTDPFYADVQFCLERSLMLGVSDTAFAPYSGTTRAMLVTVLWRMEGSPVTDDASRFDDVADGQWYTDAVRWASANGIVLGYGDGRFGPDDSITREQLAAILARYARLAGITLSNDAVLFSDDAALADWARADVSRLCASGILRADHDDAFAPQSDALRHQIASALHALCRLLEG